MHSTRLLFSLIVGVSVISFVSYLLLTNHNIRITLDRSRPTPPIPPNYHCFLTYPFEIVEDRFSIKSQGTPVITESKCCDSQTPCPAFKLKPTPNHTTIGVKAAGYLFGPRQKDFQANHQVCKSSFKTFDDVYDGSGLCPAVLRAYCNETQRQQQHSAHNDHTAGKQVCPIRRHISTRAVDIVFGDNPLWLQTFDKTLLGAALEGCVVVPGKHCGSTASECGVYIHNETHPLPSGCNGGQCCADAMKKTPLLPLPLLPPGRRRRGHQNMGDIVDTILHEKEDDDDLHHVVITYAGDSTANVFSWALQQRGWDCVQDDLLFDYDWKTKATLTEEHKKCRFLPKVGWGVWGNPYGSALWNLRTCTSTIKNTSVTVYFPQVTSLLGNRSMEPTEWPYILGAQNLGWMLESQEFRLKCSGLVFDVFGRKSDAVIFNAGHHYNHYMYRPKLTAHWMQLIKSFKTIQKEPDSKLKLVVAMDTPPSHFPNAEGTGLFNWEMRSVAKKFMACVEGALMGTNSQPVGSLKPNPANEISIRGVNIRWFPCQPVDVSRGKTNWRNDAMYEAIRLWKSTIGETGAGGRGDNVVVGVTTPLFAPLCGGHNGRHGDCLHFLSDDRYFRITTHALSEAMKMDAENQRRAAGRRASGGS